MLKFFISSNVELSYCWRFYRPITEGPSWKRCHEDTPLVNKLVSSELTPFSVDPCEGNLVAKETKKFTFNFSPTKVRVNFNITACLLYKYAYMYDDKIYVVGSFHQVVTVAILKRT